MSLACLRGQPCDHCDIGHVVGVACPSRGLDEMRTAIRTDATELPLLGRLVALDAYRGITGNWLLQELSRTPTAQPVLPAGPADALSPIDLYRDSKEVIDATVARRPA